MKIGLNAVESAVEGLNDRLSVNKRAGRLTAAIVALVSFTAEQARAMPLVSKDDKQTEYEDLNMKKDANALLAKASYSGETNEDGLPEGVGTLTDSNFKYYGRFWKGKAHGIGEMRIYLRDGNGLTIKGQFRNGLANGECTIIYFDGNKYAGKCKDNSKHGYGKMIYKKLDAYLEGEWVDDEIVSGTMISRIERNKYERYDGQFKDVRKHGEGKYRDWAGRVWEGRFENGRYIEGSGTVTFPRTRGEAEAERQKLKDFITGLTVVVVAGAAGVAASKSLGSPSTSTQSGSHESFSATPSYSAPTGRIKAYFPSKGLMPSCVDTMIVKTISGEKGNTGPCSSGSDRDACSCYSTLGDTCDVSIGEGTYEVSLERGGSCRSDTLGSWKVSVSP